MRRRAVLRGGIGVAAVVAAPGALAGCGLLTPEPPPPDPLEPLIVAKAAVLARYDATIARHPDLAEPLKPLKDAHGAHLKELLALLDPERRKVVRPKVKASASPSAGAKGAEPGESGEPSAAPDGASDVPASPDEAFTALAALEKEATARSAKACLDGAAARAALLGSISAAEATHVSVLA